MRKGKRKHSMSQSEMLAALTSLNLTGVLLKRNNVRIHAEPDVLEKLRTCGLGTRGSKRRAKARKEQETAAFEAPTFIDITLEEAYFLQSSVKCLQIVRDELAEDEQRKADTDPADIDTKAIERPALPVRVRHHGLHQGIVSRPGIHGLEEQLIYEIDTAGKPCQQSNLQSGDQERVRKPLTCEELWSQCAAKVPDWSYWYTTYHHFRSKGWLPKPGAQFGGHFVLYRSHPEVDHAEFCVRCMRGRPVAPVAQPLPLLAGDGSDANGRAAMEEAPSTSAAGTAADSTAGQQHFAWPELLAALRVAGQVRKRLILLYVHFPAGTEHGTPACLESAMVRPLPSHVPVNNCS